jgi:hypothetical protein
VLEESTRTNQDLNLDDNDEAIGFYDESDDDDDNVVGEEEMVYNKFNNTKMSPIRLF